MYDIDFHSNSNYTCRKSNDTTWRRCPVILTGHYISGKDANGNVIPLPSDFPPYCPWELRITAEENPKVAKVCISFVRSIILYYVFFSYSCDSCTIRRLPERLLRFKLMKYVFFIFSYYFFASLLLYRSSVYSLFA